MKRAALLRSPNRVSRRIGRHSRLVTALATLAFAAAAIPALSWAHAVVFPRTSAPGAYEKYVLRVPNEKAVPTTRVELRVPAGVRVTSFADVPGWKLEVVTDSAKAITAAIWTEGIGNPRILAGPDERLLRESYAALAGGAR